jgi:predicted transcriptional regulator
MTLTNKQLFVLNAVAAEAGQSIRFYSKRNESTYSYINIIAHQLEDAGLIKIEHRARGSILNLTKKGFKVFELYAQIRSIIGDSLGKKK